MYKKEFMEIAINEAGEGILNNDGGPFGATIVKMAKLLHRDITEYFLLMIQLVMARSTRYEKRKVNLKLMIFRIASFTL